MYNIFHSIFASLTKEEQLTLLSNLYQPCGKALFRAAAALFLHSLEQTKKYIGIDS